MYSTDDGFPEDGLTGFQREKLKYQFKQPELLKEALTHSSYANEHQAPGVKDNERLEFLGDAVLGAVISKQLYLRADELPEGKMTRVRSLTVREESLAEAAGNLNLTYYMRFGQGEEKSQGRFRKSNAADAMEALIGAVFLDGGFGEAERFVIDSLEAIFIKALSGKLVYDFKSQLYEYLQTFEINPDVEFVILRTEGPTHDRRFTAAVKYRGRLYPEATAASKKQAEQEAAQQFLLMVKDKSGDSRDS